MGKKEELREVRSQIREYKRKEKWANILIVIGVVTLIVGIGLIFLIIGLLDLNGVNKKLSELRLKEARLK